MKNNNKKKIISVVGARPNFMKVAPMAREFKKHAERFQHLIVHTGQHYDENMSKVFFDELEIPKPDINLEVGSGGHGEQTGKVMIEFEKVCLKENPDLVLVYGDVNSTIAAALVAVKLGIKVGHIEAGLRSQDRTMPEEINRILTDAIADSLYTPSLDANQNLLKEGIAKDKVFFVGNIMIDSLMVNKEKAAKLDFLSTLGFKPRQYALLTIHRPGNVDDGDSLKRLFLALEIISKDIPIIFPVHPRTKNALKQSNLTNKMPNLRMMDPFGYLEFLNLIMNCRFILTDSGGIQEETTALGIPCLTLRNSTERPITVQQGTNTLIGNDTNKLVVEAKNIINGKEKTGKIPKLWDGKTASRIISNIEKTI